MKWCRFLTSRTVTVWVQMLSLDEDALPQSTTVVMNSCRTSSSVVSSKRVTVNHTVVAIHRRSRLECEMKSDWRPHASLTAGFHNYYLSSYYLMCLDILCILLNIGLSCISLCTSTFTLFFCAGTHLAVAEVMYSI